MQFQIRRIMLFVKDMKAMTQFYEAQMGLTVLVRSDDFVDFDGGGVTRRCIAPPRRRNPPARKSAFMPRMFPPPEPN